MNPIKFLFFLLSLAFVGWFWLGVTSSIFEKDKHPITALCLGIAFIYSFATTLYLTYQIPYSIYWLMMNWGWEP